VSLAHVTGARLQSLGFVDQLPVHP
jgi:hypothetical protein